MGRPTEFSIHPLKGLLLNKNSTRYSATLKQGQALECENRAQALGVQGQWLPSISSLRCPKWTPRGALTTAHSCIFITSRCTPAYRVSMAALGEGRGERGQGLPQGLMGVWFRNSQGLTPADWKPPTTHVPLPLSDLEMLSQHNLEGPEYQRRVMSTPS